MPRLAYRAACKVFELGLRLATWLRHPLRCDPTLLLLEHQTPAQRQAELSLTAAGAVPCVRSDRVLVVIPFRDRWELTAACIASLRLQNVAPLAVHVLLLDNGSRETTTQAGIARLLAAAPPPGLTISCLRTDGPFNFSRLNNLAVQSMAAFAPDWLLFLNNDVELPRPDDLASLVAFAGSCPRLGALGCTLDYPDGTVQHLFVAPGVKIVAAHPLKGRRLASSCRWFAAPRPVAAVTGAALLVRADAYAAVGGFDEALPTVGQDVDLCLALQGQGLVNWVLPSVRLVHREGASRGGGIDRRQVAYMYDKWGARLTANPFWSARFSRFAESPTLRLVEPPYPWKQVLG